VYELFLRVLEVLLGYIAKGASYLVVYTAGKRQVVEDQKRKALESKAKALEYKDKLRDRISNLSDEELQSYLEGYVEIPDREPPSKPPVKRP